MLVGSENFSKEQKLLGGVLVLVLHLSSQSPLQKHHRGGSSAFYTMEFGLFKLFGGLGWFVSLFIRGFALIAGLGGFFLHLGGKGFFFLIFQFRTSFVLFHSFFGVETPFFRGFVLPLFFCFACFLVFFLVLLGFGGLDFVSLCFIFWFSDGFFFSFFGGFFVWVLVVVPFV